MLCHHSTDSGRRLSCRFIEMIDLGLLPTLVICLKLRQFVLLTLKRKTTHTTFKLRGEVIDVRSNWRSNSDGGSHIVSSARAIHFLTFLQYFTDKLPFNYLVNLCDITDEVGTLLAIAKLLLVKLEQDCAQRAQTSAKASISTKRDPGFESGFPD